MATTKKFPPVEGHAEADVLTPLEWHALARAGKQAEKLRDFLAVGDAQEVDFRVRVKGLISVAGSQLSIVPTPPKLLDVLAVVFSVLGPSNRQKVFDGVVDIYPRLAGNELLPLEAQHLAKSLVGLLTIERENERRGNVTGTVSTVRLGRA